MNDSFLSGSLPPLSFYHRFLRVLLGIAMILLALYSVAASFSLLFFATIFSDLASKSPFTVADAIIIVILLLVIAGAIFSVIAATKVIRKSPINARDTLTTAYAVLNILALIFHWNRFSTFDSHNEGARLALLMASGLLYLGSALAIILFSRRQGSATSIEPPRSVE